MSWISARAISPQADLPAQTTFKKTFALRVRSVVPSHVASDQVDIWFQDEMRIGQRGTQTRLWTRKGTRPRVVRRQQSESAYIFGAFFPAQDRAAGVVLPHANTEAMGHQLQAVSEVIPAGRHAVVVLDRASWHTTPNLPRGPMCRCCQRDRPNSIPQDRYGSNCATGIWLTDALTVTTRLLMPVAMPGIPSAQFPVPSTS